MVLVKFHIMWVTTCYWFLLIFLMGKDKYGSSLSSHPKNVNHDGNWAYYSPTILFMDS